MATIPEAQPVQDPIRIVPLHTPPGLLKRAVGQQAPDLTYRGGVLLTNVKVFTVFWGTGWNEQAVAGVPAQINDFFKFILTSALIHQIAEYNTAEYKIGHGSLIGTATVTTPAPKKSTSDASIQKFLKQEIAKNKAFPQPDANTLYFVFTPPGIEITQGGGGSCTSFCGYHDSIGEDIFYAAMPYPNCQGCTGSLAAFDALTSTSSHELCEAITDPIPGTGWYDDYNGEVGDICAWQTKTIGKYTVQLEWSQKHGKCM